MSTRPYGPNDEYRIGYEGLESSHTTGIPGLAADAFRLAYQIPFTTITKVATYKIKALSAVAIGALDLDGYSAIPTYGLWAGPKWAAGHRGGAIDWKTPPCMNNHIIGSANPDNCYSLVDAICKAHDWRYDQADINYSADPAGNLNAKKNADVIMLQEIAEACRTNMYTETVGSWEHRTFSNTFDSDEKLYVAKLVPLFWGKMTFMNNADANDICKTWGAITSIASVIPVFGEVFQDPSDPSNKWFFNLTNGLVVTQTENATNSNVWIVDPNSDAKPVNISIDYGTGSVKAGSPYTCSGGVIRVNGGTGDDKITISGANNSGSFPYTFEISGSDGNDTYKLDSHFNYKLIDSGKENAIYVEDGSGGWVKIDNLFQQTNGAYQTQDGSISLSGSTIILSNGSTINLGSNFQSGDYGITLRPRLDTPGAPSISNTIYGDLKPEDQDPETEGVQIGYDQWGNVIVSEESESGRSDVLYDHAGNDLINAGGGDDSVYACCGGENSIYGGGGNDYLNGDASSKCYIEGGTGRDIIYGSAGNDELFADSYGGMQAMITAGESAASSGGMGELITGNGGNDFVYGASATDALFGGVGNDTVENGKIILFSNKQRRKDAWLRFSQQENLRRAA